MSEEIVVEAGDVGRRRGWSEGALRWLIAELVLLAAVTGVIGTLDLLRHARDIPTLCGAMIWLGAAILSTTAVFAIRRNKSWWPQAVLGAQAVALALAVYVVWVELSSPHSDLWLRLVPLVPIAIALMTIPHLCLSSGALPSKVWAGALAALTALGLSQFVLESQILPNRAPPPLDVTAQLEEIGRTGSVHVLRGRVTWKNNGKARALVLGALATVVAKRAPAVTVSVVPDAGPAAPTGPAGAPVTRSVAPSVPPTTANARPALPSATPPTQSNNGSSTAAGETVSDGSYDDAQLIAMAQSIDPLHYASGVYTAPVAADQDEAIIWMEDLTVPRWFVLPGQSETREFTITVDRREVSSLELRVDAWFATNLIHEPWRTCVSKTELSSDAFLAEFHALDPVDPRPCLMAPIKPTNTVRSMADDNPLVWIEYVLDDDGYFGGLVAFFGSAEFPQDVGEDEVEKINRTRPVAGAAVIAAWASAETLAGG